MFKWGAGSWRIPTQFAGTSQDNWFTRAMVDNSAGYMAAIEQALESELQGL